MCGWIMCVNVECGIWLGSLLLFFSGGMVSMFWLFELDVSGEL